MLDKIEEFMNLLTDTDMGWWPFLFLRPAKNEDMTNLVLLKLTLAFGSFLGLFIWGWLYLRLNGFSWQWQEIIFSFVSGWFLFFFSYKTTFAYFWNRRARRLRGES